MSDDNICDICFQPVEETNSSIHAQCKKMSFVNKFKELTEFDPFKKILETYFDDSLEVDSFSLDELVQKKGFIILNNHVVALSLVNCDLTEFPSEIFQFPRLRVLILSNNNIVTVPEPISSLNLLQRLYLNNNNLQSIHPNIKYLVNLQDLHLNNNVLDSLPDELFETRNIETLALENNKLTTIPEPVQQLRVLRRALFQGNTISCIPKSLAELPYLDELFVDPNEQLLQKYPKLEISDQSRIYRHKLQECFK